MTNPSDFPLQVPDGHVATLQNPARLTALNESGLVDTAPEEAFDRIVRIATIALRKPVGLLSLVDGRRQFFKASVGLAGTQRETPLTHSFCQYVVGADAPLAVEDAREHALLKDNLAVSELDVVAYLGVPVHAPNGQALGSFCAIDGEPHDWTEEEHAVLSDLAAIIETEMRLRDEAQKRQLLMRELDHRVKNLFAVVGSMITMTGRQSTDTDAMAEVLTGRINALSQAHDLIRPAVAQNDAMFEKVSLQELVASLIRPYVSHESDRLTLDGAALLLSSSGTTNMALIIHEFATNAAKYGSLSVPNGWLSVTWQIEDERVTFNWTEKGGPKIDSEPDRTGFGSKLITMTITSQLQGKFTTEWHPEGVRHIFSVPVASLQQ